jgi:N6-adenosine-specific RNA methylase IME4
VTWEGLSPPYSTVVADPPWPHDEQPTGIQRGERGGRPKSKFLPYSSMSVEEIAALPVYDLSGSGSHLYLWTTNRFLTSGEARAVALSWGFTPVKTLVWCKEPMGLGQGGRFTNTTEFVIFACREREDRHVERAGSLIKNAREQAGMTRADLHRLVRGGQPTGIVYRWERDDLDGACLPGAQDWQRLQEVLPALRDVPRPFVPPPSDAAQLGRVDTTWWQWKRGPHSSKPPAFLDVVEQVSPGPYVELFARQPRLGWDSWGWGYEGATA